MAANPFNLTVDDIRYGHICSICAGPKSPQAARCRRCYADAKRKGPRVRVQSPRFVCPDCSGSMWAPDGLCRACWLAHGVKTQPENHPWRSIRIQPPRTIAA